MKIIIAGAGDVGFHLAKLLSYESQDTYIIDFDGEKLEYLNSHLDIITKKGDATSIQLLKEIGIDSADLLRSGIQPLARLRSYNDSIEGYMDFHRQRVFVE